MYLNVGATSSAVGLGALPPRARLVRTPTGRVALRIPVPLLIRTRPRGIGDLASDCSAGNAAACKQYYATVYAQAPSVVAAQPAPAPPANLPPVDYSNPTALTQAVLAGDPSATAAQKAYDAKYFATVPQSQWPILIQGGGSPYMVYLASLQNPGGAASINSNILAGSGVPTQPAVTLPSPTQLGVPSGGSGGSRSGGGGGAGGGTAAVTPPSATLQNVTRGGSSSFQVGDTWAVVIQGAAVQPVTVKVSHNGSALPDANYGNTDASGQQRLTGTITADSVGTWSEQWYVGGILAGSFSFTVVAPATTGSTSGGGGGGGGSTTTSTSTTGGGAPPVVTSVTSALSFLTNPVTIAGFGIPLWVLLGAGGAALYLYSQNESGGAAHRR